MKALWDSDWIPCYAIVTISFQVYPTFSITDLLFYNYLQLSTMLTVRVHIRQIDKTADLHRTYTVLWCSPGKNNNWLTWHTVSRDAVTSHGIQPLPKYQSVHRAATSSRITWIIWAMKNHGLAFINPMSLTFSRSSRKSLFISFSIYNNVNKLHHSNWKQTSILTLFSSN